MKSPHAISKKELDLNRLLNAFPDWFLKHSKDEQIVSLSIYRLLVKGKPVSKRVLAEVSGIPVDRVEKILSSWSGIYFNDVNEIIGYWGLGLVEMPHQFIVDGITLYTWCAWDALFIPQLIEKSAMIRSTCPISKQNIQLEVAPKGIESLTPESTLITFIDPPSSEKIKDDLVGCFCHFVHFIYSADEIKKWESEHQGSYLYLEPNEAYELGQLKNRTQYTHHYV